MRRNVEFQHRSILNLSLVARAFILILCFSHAGWGAIDLQLEKAENLADKNPIQAMEILQPYLAEDFEFESTDQKIQTWVAAAKTHLFLGNFESGLSIIEGCLLEKLNDEQRCKALITKGLILFRLGKHDASREAAQAGLDLAESLQHKRQRTSALNLLGNLCFIQGDIDGAIAYYVKTMAYLDEPEDQNTLLKVRANLGNIYLQLQQYENALTYLEPSYEAIKDSDDAQMRLVIGLNLAAVYGELGDLEKERSMYEDAKVLGEASGMDSLLVGVYLNLSDLDIRCEQWSDALLNAEKGKELADKIGDPSAMGVAWVNLGKANAGLGNVEATFANFDAAMAHFRANDSKLQESEVLGYYAEYYAKSGQFDKAYDFAQQHNESVLKIEDEKNLQLLTELRAGYDSEQKELKIRNLESEREKQQLEIQQQELQRQIDEAALEKARMVRNLLLLIILTGLAILLLFIYNYTLKVRSNRELHKLHEELKDNNAVLKQLHEQNQHLIAVVSHDLRNPLHGVIGLVDALRDLEGIRQSPELTEIVDMLEVSSTRAMEIVKNLLNSQHIQTGTFQLELSPCRLHPILETAYKENLTQARLKKQTLKFDPELLDAALCVNANREGLIQSISNLLSNAIKYSDIESTIELRAFVKGANAEIAVADSGQGIPADEIDSVFIPYTTTSVKPTGGEHSVGLGLSIVKTFVENMNGSVTCVSEVGKGSVFTISIPIATPS